ncbi:DUF6879 family protein [Nocardia sp. NBC_00416]|uniref:DUF6879 family protein n=1 Tax=Nocardia sp. NBC_00416 TaxID=2975991 RepID=UPI002E1E0A5E|nr:DUF6879 family protein [Nocardia sp. NBC_00416]
MLYLQREPPDWAVMFRDCEFEAFHLEVRDAYAVPAETHRYRRFLDGLPALPDPDKHQWNSMVREATGRGVSVTRVRVVTVPHTDYHRWLLSVTGANAEAGEDIRYVPRHLAGEVPADDWWLIDNARVVYNLVDDQGGPAGLAVTTDPGIAGYARGVRKRLWNMATPYMEYVDE